MSSPGRKVMAMGKPALNRYLLELRNMIVIVKDRCSVIASGSRAYNYIYFAQNM